MLVRYILCRVLHSSDKYLLNVTKTNKKTYGDRVFSVAAPRLCNSLPLVLKTSPSASIFKSHLKTYLFELVFNWVVIYFNNLLYYCSIFYNLVYSGIKLLD